MVQKCIYASSIYSIESSATYQMSLRSILELLTTIHTMPWHHDKSNCAHQAHCIVQNVSVILSYLLRCPFVLERTNGLEDALRIDSLR